MGSDISVCAWCGDSISSESSYEGDREAVEKLMPLIQGKNNSKTSAAERLLRPVSLLLTFGCVIAVISIVIGVVLPQLVSTMESIGQAFMAWLPQFQDWLQKTFADNPEIENI